MKVWRWVATFYHRRRDRRVILQRLHAHAQHDRHRLTLAARECIERCVRWTARRRAVR
jgi:hypothetical protein